MADNKQKYGKQQPIPAKPSQPALQLQGVAAPKAPEKVVAPAPAVAVSVPKVEVKPAPVAAPAPVKVEVKPVVVSTPKVEAKPAAPVVKAVAKVEAKVEAKSAPKVVAPAPRLVTSSVSTQAKSASSSFQAEAKVAADAVSRSSKQVVAASTDALTDITGAFASQAYKVQERVSAMGVEAIEHASRSADAAVRQMNEALGMSQQGLEAYSQFAQTTGDSVTKITEELFKFVNLSFARNIELSRDILSCRTMNDAVEWQNKLMQANVDGVLEEISTLSELMFDAAVNVVDPLGETISKAVERFSKTVAA